MTRTILENRWYLAGTLAIVLIASLAPNAVAEGPSGWAANAPHTEVNFSVNHFFTPVTGSFGDYEIDLEYDSENPEKSTIDVRIKVASIDTGNERRDNHLRSADWFEVDKYPYMTFKSTSVRQVGENQLVASGPLTIKGQSHEIELSITLLGKRMIPEQMQPMIGAKEVAGFRASTSIDRGTFGVGVDDWAGTMVVGGQVEIEILLEAHKS
ncbi:MAG: YceI family protein [Acidobacteria bacterium]|nr:YceI family protein [Acidobacteriota bacterium]